MATLPSQGQLVLPLLQTIHEAGGQAQPADLYDALAEKIHLPQWLRDLRSMAGKAGEINVWERRVRNTVNCFYSVVAPPSARPQG